ncbi:Mitochondrial substrate carrier family protein [Hibiscus syriacus]|uniref:Mitochondrial substrate carrier family protein n=1 Tax=Hibiscus syriacus TaxID=106335 RepID=A0A6A2ZHK4_HIBSY|nr:Mitochondrial substrate carrier family protein [Hibiscus syriacus]
MQVSRVSLGLKHLLCCLLVPHEKHVVGFVAVPRKTTSWCVKREDSSMRRLRKVAIATVVTIPEILKNNGLAVEKKITTSTVDMREESGGRPVQKAKGVGFLVNIGFWIDT